MFSVLGFLLTASQPRLPVSGQLGFLRQAWSPWSSCWHLWACPLTTSHSSSQWTGSCEYAGTVHTSCHTAPTKGQKLNCFYWPMPWYGDQAPDAMCIHSLISLWGTSGCYTSHSIKPCRDWEIHGLRSQHKWARPFLNCTTPHRTAGLTHWFRPCIRVPPIPMMKCSTDVPSEPNRERDSHADSGKRASCSH